MSKNRQVTTTTLRRMKADGERITMVTAYDATMAKLVDQGGADAILVGDSLGMVIQGRENTLAVTIDDVIYHTRAVARGAARAHVIADMPFMSYQADPIEAVKNAGRLIKEGGAQSVKIEGGRAYAATVERMVQTGIPVMGHVGLTPQSVHAMGGFKVQGRDSENAARILEDARALEAAGCYAVVLEGVPVELSRVITESLEIPTIGIGAGIACDGQVLVVYDLLGMFEDFVPKFVKQYAQLGAGIKDAVARYRDEVRGGAFPTDEHTFHAKEGLFRPREIKLSADASTSSAAEGESMVGLYGTSV